MDRDLFRDVYDMIPEKLYMAMQIGHKPSYFVDYMRLSDTQLSQETSTLLWDLKLQSYEIAQIGRAVKKLTRDYNRVIGKVFD